MQYLATKPGFFEISWQGGWTGRHVVAIGDGKQSPGIPATCRKLELQYHARNGSTAFRHEVPTYPMPGLTSPGFEAAGVFSPEGGDTSMHCVDPSGLKHGKSHVPVPATPAEGVSGLRP